MVEKTVSSIKNRILSRFAEDWSRESTQFVTCEKILDYLLSRPVDQLSHLTYGSLQVAIGGSDEDIVRAVQYLCISKVGVLTAHYELSDNDEDIYYPLSDEDIREAGIHGTLVHPETGELVPDYADKVLMYFNPGCVVEEALRLADS